jgi:hypothetical protein
MKKTWQEVFFLILRVGLVCKLAVSRMTSHRNMLPSSWSKSRVQPTNQKAK